MTKQTRKTKDKLNVTYNPFYLDVTMIRPDGNRKQLVIWHLFFNLKETSIPLTPRMFLHQVRDGWVFPILQKKKTKTKTKQNGSMSLPRSKPTTYKRDAFQELSSSLRAVTLFVFFITVSWRSRIVFGTCQASINICWTNEQRYEWRSSHRENPIAMQMGVT